MTAQEQARQAALRSYAILDTPPEPEFDQVVRLAARLLDVPIALISLIDHDRQWFKASTGLDGVQATPRELAFCDHAIRDTTVMIVPDATADPRFATNDLVTGDPGIRFYAGAPLVTPEGQALGTLCVIDRRPHPGMTEHDIAILSDLAIFVRDKLELRRETLRSKALAEQAALLTRLMAAAAESPDFPSAIHAAAVAIAEVTGGLFCHVWRLAADGERAVFIGGTGQGVLGEEEHFVRLKAMTLTPANSQVAAALVEERQIWSKIAPASDTESRPAASLAGVQGVTLQLATPFGLGEERYAFSVGLGKPPAQPEAMASMMREATAALRPILRRHREEAYGRLISSMMETSANGVLISEPPFEEPGPHIVFANAAFERMTGYSLAEIKGRSPRLLYGPQSVRNPYRIKGEIAAGRSVTEEVLHYRKDGTTFWTSIRIAPVADSSGTVTHYISSQTDITAMRQARLERDALTRDLQTLVAAIPGVLMRHRPRADGFWDRTFVAPGVEALTGYTVEEAIVLGWWIANIGESDKANLYAALHDAIEGSQARTDFRFRRKDGDWIWIRVLMRGHAAHDGAREVISIWSDISDEYRLAAEREAKTRELETVIDTLPGVLIRTRRDEEGVWKRIQISPNIIELTGHSVEEAMAVAWWSDNVEPDVARRAAAYFSGGATTLPMESEFRFRHKRGHQIWIRRRSRGYVDENGAEELVSIWNDITEQKNLLLEREAKTRELETLIETLPGVLVRSRRDAEGNWKRILVSANVIDLTGFSVAEAMRDAWWLENAEPDMSPGAVAFYDGEPTPIPREGELRFRHKRGHWIWIRRRSRRYQDDNGVQELVSIWNDFTDQKNLLLEREKLTADLQRIITTMPGVLVQLRQDSEGTWVCQYISPAIEALTGFTVEETKRPNWWLDNLHPAETDRLPSLVYQADMPERQTVTFRFRHKQGHYIWVNRTTSGYLAPSGQPEVISIWNDVTAEQRLLIDREELASDLQAVIEAMPGVLIRIRNSGDRWDRVYVAPGIEALTGHSVAEAMQPQWKDDNLDPADKGLLVGQMRGHFSQDQLSVEFRFRHKQGHWIWIRRIARGHIGDQGVREIIAIWQDVTHEKSLAEQFAQSAKLAQLGEVATGMAHELNQPLAGISLAAENAQRSLTRLPEPPQRALEKLGLIVDLTKRASDIIDHMRVFGRTDTDSRGPVSVAEVVKGAGQLLASKLLGGGVRLQTSLPEGLPPVLGKAVPLEQVIMNLISNACDAYVGLREPVPTERRLINVTAHAEADWISIEVRDAAGGIPGEVLPRIFEPFFTTKPVGQGTGLGLSISYGIISDMGGTISAENQGDGCLMRILLPVAL